VTVLPSHPAVPMHTLRFSPVPGRYSVGGAHHGSAAVIIACVAVILLVAGVWLFLRAWSARR
jgi:hypothetical protein